MNFSLKSNLKKHIQVVHQKQSDYTSCNVCSKIFSSKTAFKIHYNLRHISSVNNSLEKREILSHRNFFRQISSLVTSLVKTLISRNFCQKCVRVNFRNFHTVITLLTLFELLDKTLQIDFT